MPASIAKTPDGITPAKETICDGFKPFGLCNAYCEAQDCDELEMDTDSCQDLRAELEEKTGGNTFPCDDTYCPDCAEDPSQACIDQPDCGDGSSWCTCLLTADLMSCFCHEVIICSDPRVASCEDNSDCPEGWACTSSCCGVDLCHPPCGEDLMGPAAVADEAIDGGCTSAGCE